MTCSRTKGAITPELEVQSHTIGAACRRRREVWRCLSFWAAGLAVFATAFGAESYQEKWRPQFHFSPEKNWMNDPNGMVYYDGEYHLFYQYNPFGDKWGHMSWGHAVTRDLARWQHLPVALSEENGVMIFSGSAVVDWKNTSGFGKNGQPPMVAIYTGHYTEKPLQNQQIAYSTDRGRTWTKYAGNPVLDIGERDFRDPKVFWHEPTQRWVMVVAWPTHRKTRFYSSPDLKAWTHLSDFGPAGSVKGIWECPDLFPVTIEGRREQKWALIVNVGSGARAGGSGCQYFVGDFDGARFLPDPKSQPENKPAFVPAGVVLADFESRDYSGWRATGEAFGSGPARGTLPTQQRVDGFLGQGLVNTYLRGDGTEGTLTSPEFLLTNHFISFLIGGGNHPGQTCLNLVVDGKVIRTATGDANEQLSWKSWDVRDYRGKRAVLQIADRHTGGWGHINVDHILMADQPAAPALEPALWADFGPDFYAAVSWSDIPKRDSRRLWLGWMSNWIYAQDVPTSPWRSAMSLPRELLYRQTPSGGCRLIQRPVRELNSLRQKRWRHGSGSIDQLNSWLSELSLGECLEFSLSLQSPKAALVELQIGAGLGQAAVIKIDGSTEKLTIDRTRAGQTQVHPAFARSFEAPIAIRDGEIQLRVFVDTSSIEVFGQSGETVLTTLFLPDSSQRTLRLGGDPAVKVNSFDVWKLASAWGK